MLKGIKALVTGVESAPYSVIATHTGYEERVYPTKKWVSHDFKSVSRDDILSPGFRKLNAYRNGQNEPNISMDMTTPVTTFVVPGASATCESTFTMSFYIPEAFQADPPKPSEADVYIENREEIQIYTRRFGGFATDDVVAKEAAALAELLKNDGIEAIFDTYYVAGYDPPFKPIARRNEIWFVKKKADASQTGETVD